MDSIKSLFATEPAVVIGAVASIIVLLAQQLLEQGIVTSDGGVKWLNLVVAVVPLIAGILTRTKVTPA